MEPASPGSSRPSLFASAALSNTPDEGSATDQRLIDFYTDSGNQDRICLAALLGFVAGLLFLWFLVGLRDRFSRVEASGLPSLVFAAGLVFVVLWFMGSIGALPLAFTYSEEVELTDIDTLRVLLILGGHWFPGAAASTAAVVVGGASLVTRRHHLYRGWLAWAGPVVAALMLPSIVFFAGLTLIGLMVWTAATGVWLARGTRSS